VGSDGDTIFAVGEKRRCRRMPLLPYAPLTCEVPQVQSLASLSDAVLETRSARDRSRARGGPPPLTLRLTGPDPAPAYFFPPILPPVPEATLTLMDAELFASFGSATSPVTEAVLVMLVLPLTITVTMISPTLLACDTDA
jgi:hypothetical protein